MTRLDAEALALFANKGRVGGPEVPQAGDANGVKVRRVLQLVRDLAGKPMDALRVLDLGCGEGVYAIEAALAGADVTALDARTQRMDAGAACAARHGIANVRFLQDDVRRVDRERLGSFDVVLLLGLLYHLDAPDVFDVLERVRDLCVRMVVVDTLVALDGPDEATWRGRAYRGRRVREHGDDDTPEERRAKVLKSIDNTFSFRFTKRALLEALRDAGFTSVLECHVPFEPFKAPDRVTLVALKGETAPVATYPWVNGKDERAIEEHLRPTEVAAPPDPDLVRWIGRLFEDPAMLRMGHNQRADDRNLGLGWLYYALGRIVRPKRALVVGSWRGFVPLVLGRALGDNLDPGRVTFLDPSLVDGFWTDPAAVRAHFLRHGVANVTQVPMTTQDFVASGARDAHEPVGLLFIDGHHSFEQARFDYEALARLVEPRGFVLLHDSMLVRRSGIYGPGKEYETRVRDFVDLLKGDPGLQVLDVPFGSGVTLVRTPGPGPLIDGVEARA